VHLDEAVRGRNASGGGRPGDERPGPRRLARLVTEVLAPAPLSAVVLVVVALHSAASTAEALRWVVIGVLFATLIPFAYVLRGARRRRLTDHHFR
jgi:hypothetical protein